MFSLVYVCMKCNFTKAGVSKGDFLDLVYREVVSFESRNIFCERTENNHHNWMTEVSFSSAGRSEGLEAWRIDNFKANKLPKVIILHYTILYQPHISLTLHSELSTI